MSTERKVHSPARTGLDCVRMIGMYFEKPMDSEWLWREFAQESIGFDRISVSRALKHLGFSVTLKKVNAATLTQAVFPAMLEFKDGTFGLLGKLNGQTLQLQVPG